MNDIVERLREAAKDRAEMERLTPEAYPRPPRSHIEWQAADHIAALEARNARLEEQVREAREEERARCLAAVERLKQCEVQSSDRSRFSISDVNVIHRRTCNAIREEITGEAVWKSIEVEADAEQTNG